MTQEFTPLNQGNTNQCTHHTIAMFAKIPVQYVINHLGTGGQTHHNWWNQAWYFGLKLYADKVPGVPPSDGKWYFICFRYSGKKNGHLAGYKDGYVYCSNKGKYEYKKLKGERIAYHIGFLFQP
jgi:hypothetical protein